MSSAIAICVPARNEAGRLPILLAALAAQTVSATVVIALNNTTDRSQDVIERARDKHSSLNIVVDEAHFVPPHDHAGNARRMAMEMGLRVTGKTGVLIASDADTCPPPHWIAANLAALAGGLDIVGGQIRPDERENVPPRLQAIMAATARYWLQVRAIEDAIDPVAWDPAPRHGDHTGASLALEATTYIRSGGVPCIASGEDRALVDAVCRAGGHLGHPPDVWTRVSARTQGRAEFGMAQEMARLLKSPAIMLPDFSHWRVRALWRRAIREKFGAAEVIVREAALPPMPCDLALMLGEAAVA